MSLKNPDAAVLLSHAFSRNPAYCLFCLFPKDLGFIIQDAEDSLIFVDANLLPLLEKSAEYLGSVRQIVVMNGASQPSGTVTLPPTV